VKEVGLLEFRPGFVRLGNVLMLAYNWQSGRRMRFHFYRPVGDYTSYFLFCGPLEVVWEGPNGLRRRARADR
jgi:hypothetical protein